MATIRELREEARITVTELARRAGVTYKTAKRADENAGPIMRMNALSLLDELSKALGRPLKVEEIEDLHIRF